MAHAVPASTVQSRTAGPHWRTVARCCRQLSSPVRVPARHAAARRLLARAQQEEEGGANAAAIDAGASSGGAPSTSGTSGNGPLAGGAVALGVVVFAASRLLTGGPSLAALEQVAVPLDVAAGNGRPTVLEFYASWCAPAAQGRGGRGGRAQLAVPAFTATGPALACSRLRQPELPCSHALSCSGVR